VALLGYLRHAGKVRAGLLLFLSFVLPGSEQRSTLLASALSPDRDCALGPL
jgi:hypothetical protein